jgi:hypothetical protein
MTAPATRIFLKDWSSIGLPAFAGLFLLARITYVNVSRERPVPANAQCGRLRHRPTGMPRRIRFPCSEEQVQENHVPINTICPLRRRLYFSEDGFRHDPVPNAAVSGSHMDPRIHAILACVRGAGDRHDFRRVTGEGWLIAKRHRQGIPDRWSDRRQMAIFGAQHGDQRTS